MKKIRLPAELAFFLAIAVLSVGIVFYIKADFGMSVVQSCAYVLSLAMPFISFGTHNYLLQLLLITALAVVIRRFKFRYILSFGSAVLYGFSVDYCIFLMRGLTPHGIFQRIVFFIIGFILIVIAVTLFFRTNVPLMPYDIFVTEFASAKKFDVDNVKIIYDVCFLAASLILSLSIFKRLVGIGAGTIISGLFTGMSAKFLGKLIDRRIVFVPLVGGRKR